MGRRITLNKAAQLLKDDNALFRIEHASELTKAGCTYATIGIISLVDGSARICTYGKKIPEQAHASNSRIVNDQVRSYRESLSPGDACGHEGVFGIFRGKNYLWVCVGYPGFLNFTYAQRAATIAKDLPPKNTKIIEFIN